MAGVLCFLVILFVIGLRQMPGYINDEAVEILQARDLPFDRYYLFAPAYRDGFVDVIESTGPYLVHFSERLLGEGLFAIRFPYFLSFCIGIVIFSRLAGNLGGRPAANAALVLAAGSSYLLFYNRVSTRNGFSFMWIALLMTIIVRITDRRRAIWLLVALPVIGAISISSYSAFKMIVPALYCVILIDAWCRPPRLRQTLWGLTSIAVLVFILGVLVFISDTPLKELIGRGGYVLRFGENPAQTIIRRFFLAIALPVYLGPGKAFIIDITHAVFNRHAMSWVLIPPLLAGFSWILRKDASAGVRSERNLALAWLVSTALLSLGGPSLKHLHAAFPLLLLMPALGIARLYETLRTRSAPLALLVTVLICLSSVGLEINHLLRVIPSSPVLDLEVREPRRRAEVVRFAARGESLFYAEDFAKDTMRLLTRDIEGIAYLPYHRGITSEFLLRLLSGDPVRMLSFDHDPVKVFVDYPELAECFDAEMEQHNGLNYRLFSRRPDCALDWGWLLF